MPKRRKKNHDSRKKALNTSSWKCHNCYSMNDRGTLSCDYCHLSPVPFDQIRYCRCGRGNLTNHCRHTFTCSPGYYQKCPRCDNIQKSERKCDKCFLTRPSHQRAFDDMFTSAASNITFVSEFVIRKNLISGTYHEVNYLDLSSNIIGKMARYHGGFCNHPHNYVNKRCESDYGFNGVEIASRNNSYEGNYFTGKITAIRQYRVKTSPTGKTDVIMITMVDPILGHIENFSYSSDISRKNCYGVKNIDFCLEILHDIKWKHLRLLFIAHRKESDNLIAKLPREILYYLLQFLMS